MAVERNGVVFFNSDEKYPDHPAFKALEGVSLGDVRFPFGFFLVRCSFRIAQQAPAALQFRRNQFSPRSPTTAYLSSDAPDRDVLIDVDVVAAKEGEDWIWRRCLASADT